MDKIFPVYLPTVVGNEIRKAHFVKLYPKINKSVEQLLNKNLNQLIGPYNSAETGNFLFLHGGKEF